VSGGLPEEFRNLGIQGLRNLKTQQIKRATPNPEFLIFYPCPMLKTLKLET
jgi:hypothetical protein